MDAITVTDFNSNSAWGFGGGIGKMVRIGDFACRFGTAYFRHLPSEPFSRFFKFVENRRVEINEKAFSEGCGLTFKHVKLLIKEGNG